MKHAPSPVASCACHGSSFDCLAEETWEEWQRDSIAAVPQPAFGYDGASCFQCITCGSIYVCPDSR